MAVRLLVVTRFLPARDLHGGCTYLADCLSALAERGWIIECAFLSERPGGLRRVFRLPEEISRNMSLVCPGNLRLGRRLIAWRGLKSGLVRALRSCSSALFDKFRKPAQGGESCGGEFGNPQAGRTGTDRLPDGWEIRFARERMRAFTPDIVMADFTFMAPILPERSAGPVRAVLTHDVLHERLESFRKFGLETTWSSWTAEEEARLLRRGEIILAISEEEAETFRRICPQAQVVVAPMSAGGGHCEPIAGRNHQGLPGTENSQVAGRCLFVGGGDAHNVHGLKWFLAEAWPSVLKACAGATLHVCGSVCEAIREPGPNVFLLGRVADLDTPYAHAEVCIVPILAGSGIKIKLVEALSQGRACVTTTAGLRGLTMLEGGVRIADEPTDFAAAVVALIENRDLRHEMERDGLRLVRDRLSPEACYGPFADSVENLLRNRTGCGMETSSGPAGVEALESGTNSAK